jgi:hypothetical protein
MTTDHTPSLTELLLASGAPLYLDPYRKAVRASSGLFRSVLLDDPIQTVGDL